MSTELGDGLHIYFLPLTAHGHIIPVVDMAKIFASHGLKITIVTTPLSAQFVSQTIHRMKHLGFQMDVRIIKFPAVEVGLPEGCENMDFITSENHRPSTLHEMGRKFFRATAMLQEPLEMLLQEGRPDCLVADTFFPWATDAAAKFGIPRLVFHGTCFFSLCVSESLRRYKAYEKVSGDFEPFTLPGLPGGFKFTKKQLPGHMTDEEDIGINKVVKEAWEAELKSYGVVVNSFYELESTYADHYRNGLGKRAWHIGPVSLHNQDHEDKARRGKEASIDEHALLKWLDSKKLNSVIYVCFGSLANFEASQLKEIAMGLEASGQQFIWVVRKNKNDSDDKEHWLPEGFEKRIEGRGLIIRGWAPQLLILDHEATGGFVTHCGWNSTLEGITAGVPMITWPVLAEQFFNEILVTQVLKVGISVGAAKAADNIKDEAIKDAVTRIMEGEEAKEIRRKAKTLREMARKAVEEGGSSYSDLNALIEELRLHRH